MPANPVAPPRDSIARYSCARSSPDQKRLSKRSASRRARPITRRLRKMIAQEPKEASSNSPMTICTGTLAWTMSRRMESWSPTGGGLPGDDLGEERRQALRPQRTRVHARDAHVRFEERRGLPAARGPAAGADAVDALRAADRRRPERLGLTAGPRTAAAWRRRAPGA